MESEEAREQLRFIRSELDRLKAGIEQLNRDIDKANNLRLETYWQAVSFGIRQEIAQTGGDEFSPN